MSHRHLPAGQPMPGGAGVGGDMGPMHGGHGGYGGHGAHGGPRDSRRGRRAPPFHPPQYHHQPPPPPPPHMYPNYMNPYANQFYPQQAPPQYQQNGGVPSGYVHFHQPYNMRSPPSMQQYVPMAGVSVPSPYAPRQNPHSPALSTSYQPPPAPNSIPPQTPTSAHGSTHGSQFAADSQTFPPQSPATSLPEQIPPPVAAQVATPDPALASSTPQSSLQSPRPSSQVTPEPTQSKGPFQPPLPWLSRPDLPFPQKTRTRRRRRIPQIPTDASVTLPNEQHEGALEQVEQVTDAAAASSDVAQSHDTALALPPQPDVAEGNVETTVEVASSPAEESKQPIINSSGVSSPEIEARRMSRPAVPVIPVIPAVPKSSPTSRKAPVTDVTGEEAKKSGEPDGAIASAAQSETADRGSQETPQPAPRAPPSSWSALFSKPTSSAASRSQTSQNGVDTPSLANGQSSAGTDQSANIGTAPPPVANVNSIAATLQEYRVGDPAKIKFIEPRGLINSGNMCYMNSILQVLLFCVPFYDFLNQVSKRVSHSFKSQTPILDAMILFMNEFNVIDSAHSPEMLRKILKNEQLEQYGESFTPEFIYHAIEPEQRFENMRRGHQQDAQEFFVLLLQSLEEECAKVMESARPRALPSNADNSVSDGWLEVGSKQKAAVTRSSGASSTTPISQIFGGLLRSELTVTGRQNSITTEPYQALQLDVGAPNVRNVVDAIKHMTYGEKLDDSFDSARGKYVSVTKQTLIDTLPPILILHLKRFQFDATGGVSKVYKKIGYPLDLEIPSSALSKQRRLKEAPKYRLIAVVYHHGTQASGGHYTVDVRRQDEKEWIRLDDTNIKRVRSQDVAEAGEEASAAAKGASSQQKEGPRDAPANRFGAMNDEDSGDHGEWTSVDKANGGKSPWKNAVNGTGTQQQKGKQTRDNSKDNKVAYLLFYQRV